MAGVVVGTDRVRIAFTVESTIEKMLFHVILNGYWQPLDFELPQVNETGENLWRRWIDTALESPHDIVEWKSAESVSHYAYQAEARSVVILYADV